MKTKRTIRNSLESDPYQVQLLFLEKNDPTAFQVFIQSSFATFTRLFVHFFNSHITCPINMKALHPELKIKTTNTPNITRVSIQKNGKSTYLHFVQSIRRIINHLISIEAGMIAALPRHENGERLDVLYPQFDDNRLFTKLFRF